MTGLESELESGSQGELGFVIIIIWGVNAGGLY